MIAIVGCLIMAVSCQEVDRPLSPTPMPPQEIVAPTPALLSLSCTMGRNSTAISCGATSQPVSAGVRASVIYGATATYAMFFPYNLVKDTVAHTWAFTAYVQNLLKQAIGTLNGTAVTGVKIFVTDFHATAGTGAVSVANADGVGYFTSPNQPYFNYNQIVAAGGYSGTRLWKFNVPNAVTAVSMSILVATDFPAEQSVTLSPPALRPNWFDTLTATAYVPRVVSVIFKATATLADRQLAIAFVGGSVIGGSPLSIGEGFYHVFIPDSGQGIQLDTAAARLNRLPQVQAASRLPLLTGQYLRPLDGGTWRTWSLNPDSLGSEHNWALEQVNAPFAWGCSTGKSGNPNRCYRSPIRPNGSDS